MNPGGAWWPQDVHEEGSQRARSGAATWQGRNREMPETGTPPRPASRPLDGGRGPRTAGRATRILLGSAVDGFGDAIEACFCRVSWHTAPCASAQAGSCLEEPYPSPSPMGHYAGASGANSDDGTINAGRRLSCRSTHPVSNGPRTSGLDDGSVTHRHNGFRLAHARDVSRYIRRPGPICASSSPELAIGQPQEKVPSLP